MLLKYMLLLTLVAAPMFASDINATKEDLGTIEVDDKSESESDALRYSSLPVSVIDMEKYHGRNISLNEILKRVAGVRVSQTGGLGSSTTIAINGLEGQAVKVFIDGNPVNAPDGSFGINDIPVQLIERIEIYKGVVPARFGGDAMGGAINVVIKEFPGHHVDMSYGGGSFNTHRASAVFKTNIDEYDMEIGGGGFYNYAENDYTMRSPYVDGQEIKRDHDVYESFVAALAGKFKNYYFDEIAWELVRYESTKEVQGLEYNIQSAKNSSTANIYVLNFEKSDFLFDGLDLDYGFTYLDMTLNFRDKAETCYNFDGSVRPCPGLGGETSGIPKDSADKQYEVRHDLDLLYTVTDAHLLNLHANTQYADHRPHDDIASEALGYDVGSFPSERQNTVVSLGYISMFLDDAIANDAGIKYYHYDYKITSQERSLAGIPPKSENRSSDIGFYESFRYSPVEGLYLKTSYEHAFRFPNSAELFGDGIAITSSPDLLPEEADNFNLGFLFDSNDVLGMPWVKIEGNLFYRNVKNQIRLEYGQQRSAYVNQGKTEIRGFELEAHADIDENWYLFANYTNQSIKDKMKYQPGTNNVPNPTYDHDLPNIPSQFANLGIDYKTLGLFRADDMFKVFYEGSWVDEFYYGWELSKNQDRKVDAQTTHNIGFEYSFNDDMYIFGFEVRNVTDEYIYDLYNYPLSGRAYYFNARFVWFEE